MRRPSLSLAVCVALLGAASLVFAHEGEEHGAAAAKQAAAPAIHTLTATSEDFELVMKNKPLVPGKQGQVNFYLNEFATNEPVAGASIQIRMNGQDDSHPLWSGDAAATVSPGIYTAQVTAADTGSTTVIVAIQVGARHDDFALAGLEIGVAGNASALPNGRVGTIVAWVGAGLVLILTVVGLWRRRRTHPAAVLLFALIFPLAEGRAHEGHDDAPTASSQALEPGAVVYMAKESQFLLGVRTMPVAFEDIQNSLHVQGRVAPRSGGELEVVAPQSGRIYFPGGRVPLLGAHVKRGDVVATLVIVDSLHIRAAIAGVVTEAPLVNGQLVEAGQRILRILDSSVLWVHADVYERDLGAVEASKTALISSPGFPGQVFPGRRVAVGASLGEVQGTVETYFETPNPGGRLRVGMLVDVQIQQGESRPTLVVPRSALSEKDGRKLVFVHTGPERFAAREVRIVSNLGDRVSVDGTLAAGERVVTSGSYQLLSAPVLGLAE